LTDLRRAASFCSRPGIALADRVEAGHGLVGVPGVVAAGPHHAARPVRHGVVEVAVLLAREQRQRIDAGGGGAVARAMRTSIDSPPGSERFSLPLGREAVSIWLQPAECPQPTGLPKGKPMPLDEDQLAGVVLELAGGAIGVGPRPWWRR
jgi:hypothetical protein